MTSFFFYPGYICSVRLQLLFMYWLVFDNLQYTHISCIAMLTSLGFMAFSFCLSSSCGGTHRSGQGHTHKERQRTFLCSPALALCSFFLGSSHYLQYEPVLGHRYVICQLLLGLKATVGTNPASVSVDLEGCSHQQEQPVMHAYQPSLCVCWYRGLSMSGYKGGNANLCVWVTLISCCGNMEVKA